MLYYLVCFLMVFNEPFFILGNTAQRPPDGLVPYMLRPKEVPSGYSFPLVPHKNRLITVRLTVLVLHILTKK